jgi:NADH-quinone oxidoreductase subunit C
MKPNEPGIIALEELGEQVAAVFPKDVLETDLRNGELTVRIVRNAVVRILTFLRDDVNFQFRQLMDVCGVDHPEREERFDVVYNLLSLSHNMRMRIKVSTNGSTPVPSVTGVFSSANWWEREAWDMFGIYFSNHPDLRRIMTDYGFEGYPLRKDFPLTGHVEVRYDNAQKRVVYEPVKLAQEFRTFDFLSPWEGMQSVLPGDEKADTGSREDDS